MVGLIVKNFTNLLVDNKYFSLHLEIFYALIVNFYSRKIRSQ